VDHHRGVGLPGERFQGRCDGVLAGLPPFHDPEGRTEGPAAHLLEPIPGHRQGDAPEFGHPGRQEGLDGGLEERPSAPIPELLGDPASHAEAAAAGGDQEIGPLSSGG